jgi:hypothetical protein
VVSTYSAYVLDVDDFDDAYSSTILTNLKAQILTNIADTGTGIATATEDDMYNRLRARVLKDSSRHHRRITSQLNAQIPYGGFQADALKEADQEVVKSMEEIEWRITEKQADMTFQYRKDKTAEAIQMIALDKNVTDTQLDRKLRATLAEDEMKRFDHWKYFEILIKQYVDYIQYGIEYVYKLARGLDQMTFNNYMEMSNTMAAGQLRIAALVGDMIPSNETTAGT